MFRAIFLEVQLSRFLSTLSRKIKDVGPPSGSRPIIMISALLPARDTTRGEQSKLIYRSAPPFFPYALLGRGRDGETFSSGRHAIYPRDPPANDTKRAYGHAVNPSRPEVRAAT